jgi:hypothetical protein
MAKKVVATMKDKSTIKGMTKVIKMVKNKKTGAYTFVEDIVADENVKGFFVNI